MHPPDSTPFSSIAANMAAPELHPYFASTYADQLAQDFAEGLSFKTIVELIDHLAEIKPDSEALGYADFTFKSTKSQSGYQLSVTHEMQHTDHF